MDDVKIIDLIPEPLKEKLIEEIAELLKQRNKDAELKAKSKPPAKEQLDEILKRIR